MIAGNSLLRRQSLSRVAGVVVGVAVAMMVADAVAEVRLATVFADHMVLQRGRPVPVWGWADASSTIAVRWAGQTAEVIADEDGAWEAVLEPLTASAEGRTLVVACDDEQVLIQDVLVGDIWHASGQSNMAMTLAAVLEELPAAGPLVATADLPAVRFCRIDAGESREPLEDLASPAQWRVCTPETVRSFSAAAFFCAERLHRELGVPIAVIDTSRGGTPIEPFIPREAFVGHPTLIEELTLGDRDDLDGIWRLPGGVRARDGNWLPGRLFHARLVPLARMPVRGCLWYQGESNAGVQEDPRDYEHKMRALVRGWRLAFDDQALPFFYVQLPGSGAGEGWPYLREQQRLAGDEPGVGMVVTVDLQGEGIHPPNKVDVGRRLAAWALAEVHGQEVPAKGPSVASHEIRGREVVVRFADAEGGLITATKRGLEPPRETPGMAPALFEVADRAGRWHAATARIAGDAVIVTSDAVAEPVAARYAYAVTPQGCNLYSRAGLPASPFCTNPALLVYDPQLPD
jgi:sialate O-acetylesterase